MSTGLWAGVGRSTITAPVGIAHGGWGAQEHERAAGIEQEMYATALMLSTAEVTTLIVDLDLGILTMEDAHDLRSDLAEALDTPTDNIRVSYTHTHAGPVTTRHSRFLRSGQELVGPYLEAVRAQTVGAARQARLGLRECRLSAGWGRSDIAVNRRFQTPEGRVVIGQNADGYTDDRVLVVRLEDLHEQPIACVVGYACHPITLAYQNQLLSPDFPGVTRRVVEDLTGATCLYLQGCAGDLMPIEALTGDITIHRRHGTRLGAEAAKVCLGLKGRSVDRRYQGVLESGAPLAIWQEKPHPDEPVELNAGIRSVTLAVRPTRPAHEVEAELKEVLTHMDRLRAAEGTPQEVRDLGFRAKRLGMLAHWSRWCDGGEEVRVDLHGLRIGPVGLIGFPGEPFSEIGVMVRDKSPLPFTQLAGYTNGWQGYVPTADAFVRGGYEVETGSTFGPTAAMMLATQSVDLLEELCAQ